MVQNEEVVIDEGNAPSPSPINPENCVPEGRYRIVGWGVDTTGRRLIDEICQIAAYTPTSQFSQYIMPFADLNPVYRKRHNIRIINSGNYRMLKDLRTNKFVKTKSEVTALIDFLNWLEKTKGDAEDGIILIYHEYRKASPGMLLEALRRYNLIERFNKVVKGFANGFIISQAKCGKTTNSFSLRVMAKILLNKEKEDFSNAVDRAKATYDVVVHLGQGERPDLSAISSSDCTGTETHIVDFIRSYSMSISAEEEEIAVFKVLLERQNTFKPVFGAFLRATRTERQHATHLRRLLAENNIDYEKLKIAYESGAKEGLDKVLKDEVANAQEKDLAELLEILDCFFDPEKKAVQPKPRFYQNNYNRRNNRTFKGKENKNKSINTSSEVSTNTNSGTATTDSVSSAPSPRQEIDDKQEIEQTAVAVQ